MFYPFQQKRSFEVTTFVPYPTETVLDRIEAEMLDAHYSLRKRSPHALKYVKADIFKYPHPRNLVHNLTFNTTYVAAGIRISVISWNWELLAMLAFAGLMLIFVDKESYLLIIPVLLIIFFALSAIKQYFLRVIASNIEALMGDL